MIGTVLIALGLGCLTLIVVFVLPWRNGYDGSWNEPIINNWIRRWLND